MDKLVRQRGQIFESHEAALAAGYPDAEFGWWIPANGDIGNAKQGWIALDYED